MNLAHAPVNMYKRFFKILIFVFAGVFVLEFVAAMTGNPIAEITINDTLVKPETTAECLSHAGIAAIAVDGIVNVFLVIRIIKEKLRLSHWPALPVVIMTLFFPLELVIGILLVVPNIIIFGLKGRIKNRAYEVDF